MLFGGSHQRLAVGGATVALHGAQGFFRAGFQDMIDAQLGHAGTDVTRRHYVEQTHQGPDARAILARLG